MMNNYQKKPEFVTAYQFDGTDKSAKQIVNDLHIPNPRYEYNPDNSLKYFGVEQHRVRHANAVASGSWFIKHANDTVELLTDDQFKERYIPA
jgi:hypothetical protein